MCNKCLYRKLTIAEDRTVLIPSHNNNHSIQKCGEKKQDGSNGVRASEGYKPE